MSFRRAIDDANHYPSREARLPQRRLIQGCHLQSSEHVLIGLPVEENRSAFAVHNHRRGRCEGGECLERHHTLIGVGREAKRIL
jgi:hypothetical protein